MNLPFSLLALLVGLPAYAGSDPSPQRVLDQASRAGFAVPAAFDPAPIPALRAGPVRRAASPIYGGAVQGSGRVSGTAFVFCRQRPDDRHPELVQAQLPLTGSIEVTGAGGARGYVHVQGNAWLTGWCRQGQLQLDGQASLAGSGPLLVNGVPVGSAHVSGHVFIRYYGWPGAVSADEWVSVSGSLSPY